jgi:hypothetical protein
MRTCVELFNFAIASPIEPALSCVSCDASTDSPRQTIVNADKPAAQRTVFSDISIFAPTNRSTSARAAEPIGPSDCRPAKSLVQILKRISTDPRRTIEQSAREGRPWRRKAREIGYISSRSGFSNFQASVFSALAIFSMLSIETFRSHRSTELT